MQAKVDQEAIDPRRQFRMKLLGCLACICSGLLWVLSIPPFEFAEGAYIAFVPLLLWLYGRQTRRSVLLCGLVTGWVVWFAILIWLRHVTLFGTIALSGILALFFVTWLWFASWVLPGVARAGFLRRLIAFIGLAGAWVVLEWVRSWLFWGFPWGPLALSQWERPVVLQIAAWTGAYGVSFLLVFFNCCVAHTLRSRLLRREGKLLTGLFCPDLYVALGSLGFCIYIFAQSLPEFDSEEVLFSAGVVQPYIKPELKWDQELAMENLDVLFRQTRLVAVLEKDVILWPEAATPWPVGGYSDMQVLVERLVNELGQPILMGNLYWDQEKDLWYNGSFLVQPETGLAPDYYVKRELVPFGEFVPPIFSFIDKVVPVGGNYVPGVNEGLISLDVKGRRVNVGSLVCYEDIFPRLARESALAGADVFFVATNNAWYGEEGGAPQHAAHSVLRAVENRRPVIRCGNGGWSGWIDSYGSIREVVRDEKGSVYFRGGGSYEVSQFAEWSGKHSIYTLYGDWFVALSGAFVLLTLISAVSLKRQNCLAPEACDSGASAGIQ